MQFYLDHDELKLFADVLLNQDFNKYNGLLSKVMAGDLRLDADEFLEASDILASRRSSLNDEIACQTNPAQKAELQRKLALLDRVLDKVNECCVMF